MKLLIITQVMDREHPVLGFFCRWVEEFAHHCEVVNVICLQEGSHDLPKNVMVHSLGKERGNSRVGYVLNFYKLVWSLRGEYENVFVHMNQVYVILGAVCWRILNKKVGLWYAHGTVTTSLKIAVKLADVVFTSTEQGLRIVTPKRKIVGQGIDTEMFKPQAKTESGILKLITVGRVSASKNIDTLLRACALLKEKDVAFSLKIVGPCITDSEVEYFEKMKVLATELKIENDVEWVGSLPQSSLPNYLQSADYFIHDGSTNSLDKALLEAALCGCVVVSSNPSYRALTQDIAPELLFSPKNYNELSEVIENTNSVNRAKVDKQAELIRDKIAGSYSVGNLISGILAQYF